MYELIDKLYETQSLTRSEWVRLIEGQNDTLAGCLFERAREVRHRFYGRKVYIRGLIEISNYCKNDCYYCGIRKSNHLACRYRLTTDEIIACTDIGYTLGFRTFVLQGGEDRYYTDDLLCQLIRDIKGNHPDCAVTLSLGERTRESYERLFTAGADRYLLRHETSSPSHYEKLHPASLRSADRKSCLDALKEIGYQTGSGFMVGSPFQTPEHLAEDMLYLHKLQPQMVGIGPFIPHRDTPFRDYPAGSVSQTLFFLGLLRLMLPAALLPATTALGTLDPKGREKGILAGANVVMPNLSPPEVRDKYALYNNKLSTGCEAAEHLEMLKARFEAVGYHLCVDRGDYPL